MVRRLLLVALVAAVGAAGAYAWLEARPGAVGDLPVVEHSDPAPDSPPVVWVSGTLTGIDATGIEVREGEGSTVRLQRFAEGATHFLHPSVGEWERLGEGRIARIRPGRRVCVEALLDDRRLLALRVFLETRCAPTP